MEVREELEQAIGLPLQSQLMPFQRSNMARLAPLRRCCMSGSLPDICAVLQSCPVKVQEAGADGKAAAPAVAGSSSAMTWQGVAPSCCGCISAAFLTSVIHCRAA